MTTLREAAQQALEALEYYQHRRLEWDYSDEVAITALKAALAEPTPSQQLAAAGFTRRDTRLECDECGGKFTRQMLPIHKCKPVQEPAQQDNETIAQTFSGLPKRKLRELLAAGWQINGVCFQRTEEDGTVRRGAATTGGMVLWWNQEQPAQQQEPVAWLYRGNLHATDPSGWCIGCHTPLYTAPPQRKPLTEEEIDALALVNSYLAFARAIERAHGIGGNYE